MTKYLDAVQKLTEVPEQPDGLVKHIHDSKLNVLNSGETRTYFTAKGQSKEKIKKDFLAYSSARLAIVIELFEADELDVEAKISIAFEILKIIQTIVDLDPELAGHYQQLANVIIERVSALQAPTPSSELHYWPTGAVPFHQAMKKLRDNKFILDISLAEEIFKRFDNQTGQTLKWNGSKRELIYFLLVLYGGRNHIAETITDIAFKIFTLKRVCPRKQFTSDIVRIEEIINSDFEYAAGSKYYCLKDILVPSQK